MWVSEERYGRLLVLLLVCLRLPTHRCVRLFKVARGGRKETYNVVPMDWIMQVVHIPPSMSLLGPKDALKKRAFKVPGPPVIAYVNKFAWGL